MTRIYARHPYACMAFAAVLGWVCTEIAERLL